MPDRGRQAKRHTRFPERHAKRDYDWSSGGQRSWDQKHRARFWALALLLMANALANADRHIFSVLISDIKREFGATDAIMGTIGGPALIISYVLFGHTPCAAACNAWTTSRLTCSWTSTSIPGFLSRKRASRRGNTLEAADIWACIRMQPCTPSRKASMSSIIRSNSENRLRKCASNASPAGVRVTPRWCRSHCHEQILELGGCHAGHDRASPGPHLDQAGSGQLT